MTSLQLPKVTTKNWRMCEPRYYIRSTPYFDLRMSAMPRHPENYHPAFTLKGTISRSARFDTAAPEAHCCHEVAQGARLAMLHVTSPIRIPRTLQLSAKSITIAQGQTSSLEQGCASGTDRFPMDSQQSIRASNKYC
jgi:hypothetical protein